MSSDFAKKVRPVVDRELAEDDEGRGPTLTGDEL
jgi:hypothetical protein|tara:strand:+ start:14466 stop:14567 length:102 start_codon:yes stop_codon:yes gene_type:complete